MNSVSAELWQLLAWMVQSKMSQIAREGAKVETQFAFAVNFQFWKMLTIELKARTKINAQRWRLRRIGSNEYATKRVTISMNVIVEITAVMERCLKDPVI